MLPVDAKEKKIFEEQIEFMTKKPLKTDEQTRTLLGHVATGVLSISRGQRALAQEVYGNGIPGGLKEKINKFEILLTQSITTISDMKDEQAGIKQIIMEEFKGEKQGRRASDIQLSTSDKLLSWFIEKVLPALVIAVMLMVGNGLFFAVVGWVAYQNGLLQKMFSP